MTVANTRIDDHIPPAAQYLIDIETHVIGDYSARSMDPTNVGSIFANITADGNYSTEMYDTQGNHNKTVHGGMKFSASNHTTTITSHVDHGVGGGVRENFGTGHFKSIGGGSSYHAINGPAISAAAESHMTLSTGGDGHHAVQGDQSFIVQNGGIHHSVDKDYTISAIGVIHQAAGSEFSVMVDGNEGHTAGNSVSFHANNTMSINAISSIVLSVGQNSLVINTTGIFLNSSANINMTSINNLQINSISGNVSTNGVSTQVQGGGLTAPPTTFQ